MEKQVNKSHYGFTEYMTKERWNSVWHQVDETIALSPVNVLEIGPGTGLFKEVAEVFGIDVETLDLDAELCPDHVGSATALPFPDGAYDVVCSFQMLEHLPYEESLKAFEEMVRVSRRNVIISIPDARSIWHYKIYIPKIGSRDFLIPRPRIKLREHKFDGEHYWEVNKRGYALEKVSSDLMKTANLVETYRVVENPYHRFFIFKKQA